MDIPAEYYRTNPERNGILGHVSFGVRSYERSKKFYTSLLESFGIKLVYDNPERKTLGYGLDADHEILNIFQLEDAHPPGAGTHLAFNAPSRRCVRDFWEAGTKNGGLSDGEPGIREHYGPRYYAAFLFDPDGYKLEAVFQGEETGGIEA